MGRLEKRQQKKGNFIGDEIPGLGIETETKSVIRKDVVSLNSKDEWKGAFENPKTDTDLIHSYYSQIIANALLEKYDELNKWINTIE